MSRTLSTATTITLLLSNDNMVRHPEGITLQPSVSPMPFSQGRTELIKERIRQTLATGGGSAWDASFLKDMKARFDRYGTETSLSAAQHKQLERILRLPQEDGRVGSNVVNFRTPRRIKRPKIPSRFRFRSRTRWAVQTLSLSAALFGIWFALANPHPGGAHWNIFQSPIWDGSSSSPSQSGSMLVDRVTRVRDGDTIVVGLIPIRIANLDCAESGTAAGERATKRAKQLVANQTVQCRLEGRRSYDREVGVCALEDGQDFGEVLISEGICRRWRG